MSSSASHLDAKLEPPVDMQCPIGLELMEDPVMVDGSCRHVYDRKNVERWLEGHDKCPSHD